MVYAYNSACPSFCNYEHYRSLSYVITSTILLEVLIKKILLVTKGRYRGVHVPSYLLQSLSREGVTLRKFTKEENYFLELDHSYIRYNWTEIQEEDIKESVVDGLFEYFLDLALQLGVE